LASLTGWGQEQGTKGFQDGGTGRFSTVAWLDVLAALVNLLGLCLHCKIIHAPLEHPVVGASTESNGSAV